jgi:hypothetical protein
MWLDSITEWINDLIDWLQESGMFLIFIAAIIIFLLFLGIRWLVIWIF